MPADFVGKFQRMLQDVELNREMNRRFRAALAPDDAALDVLSFKVLNAGAWAGAGGTATGPGLVLPRELDELAPRVERFYRAQHGGRRLRCATSREKARLVCNAKCNQGGATSGRTACWSSTRARARASSWSWARRRWPCCWR